MKLVIPNFYEKAVSLFGHRLQIKHKVKGLAHREMSYATLKAILDDEVTELSVEVTEHYDISSQGFLKEQNLERMINEALDVMICGMIIVDRALQELKNNE